jgi:two-component system sensor histidine kinase VicK
MPASHFLSNSLLDAMLTRLRKNSVILLSVDGIVLEINSAFTNYFGYTDTDIIGKNFTILFTEENKLKDLPQRELNTALTDGQHSDDNYLVNKDRNHVWVTGESIRVDNESGDPYILKIIYDLQVLKESEASIIRLNDLNENILSSINDIVLVLNEQLQIEKANKAFFDLFNGRDKEDVATALQEIIRQLDDGKDLSRYINEADPARAVGMKKRIFLTAAPADERIFDVQCTRLKVNEKMGHILLAFHDVTSHLQIQREREDIIGFVAHELRNPLANIMLCNEMINHLVHENKKDEIVQFVTRSNNNTMRLNKMINELNDATKTNSGNFNLEISTFDLADMIAEAVNTIATLQPAYTITVNNKAGQLQINGDRYRLVQVVTNFLSNSIKYSNGNTNIEISLRADASSVTVSVKDEGLGIARSQLPGIFQRFFRAEKTKNMEGIGLGLYLCRQIILAHKGDIWVESEESKGSTFYFSLPLN